MGRAALEVAAVHARDSHAEIEAMYASAQAGGASLRGGECTMGWQRDAEGKDVG